VCLNHGSHRHRVSVGEAGTASRVPGNRTTARVSFTRRGFVAALLAGVSSTALVACDPADIGGMFVSEDQVEQMGVETWERIRAETPASDNRSYQERSRQVADRILSAAGEDPGAWEVQVFAPDEANAFALPGNKIGLYDGIFRFIDNDDQLAAVIGHEIGHNQAQHAQERISTQLATEFGLQLVSAALQVGNVGYANEVAALLGAGAQFGVILPYNRNQELEADRIGLRNMAQAGYDPRAAIQLWENMRQAGARPPEFLSTHPAPEARIEALERMMPEALELYRGA
jgi:predicted Zn-dependent protease